MPKFIHLLTGGLLCGGLMLPLLSQAEEQAQEPVEEHAQQVEAANKEMPEGVIIEHRIKQGVIPLEFEGDKAEFLSYLWQTLTKTLKSQLATQSHFNQHFSPAPLEIETQISLNPTEEVVAIFGQFPPLSMVTRLEADGGGHTTFSLPPYWREVPEAQEHGFIDLNGVNGTLNFNQSLTQLESEVFLNGFFLEETEGFLFQSKPGRIHINYSLNEEDKTASRLETQWQLDEMQIETYPWSEIPNYEKRAEVFYLDSLNFDGNFNPDLRLPLNMTVDMPEMRAFFEDIRLKLKGLQFNAQLPAQEQPLFVGDWDNTDSVENMNFALLVPENLTFSLKAFLFENEGFRADNTLVEGMEFALNTQTSATGLKLGNLNFRVDKLALGDQDNDPNSIENFIVKSHVEEQAGLINYVLHFKIGNAWLSPELTESKAMQFSTMTDLEITNLDADALLALQEAAQLIQQTGNISSPMVSMALIGAFMENLSLLLASSPELSLIEIWNSDQGELKANIDLKIVSEEVTDISVESIVNALSGHVDVNLKLEQETAESLIRQEMGEDVDVKAELQEFLANQWITKEGDSYRTKFSFGIEKGKPVNAQGEFAKFLVEIYKVMALDLDISDNSEEEPSTEMPEEMLEEEPLMEMPEEMFEEEPSTEMPEEMFEEPPMEMLEEMFEEPPMEMLEE